MTGSQSSTLKRFATSEKAKNLLNEFIKTNNLTEKAQALGGVCELVGYEKGRLNIEKLLLGTHKLSKGVPLLTLERFWKKHVSDFSIRKLTIRKTAKQLSMVSIDKMLSMIGMELYNVHSKVISGEF